MTYPSQLDAIHKFNEHIVHLHLRLCWKYVELRIDLTEFNLRVHSSPPSAEDLCWGSAELFKKNFVIMSQSVSLARQLCHLSQIYAT